MKSAAHTITAPNGNIVNLSPALDPRILGVFPASQTVVARSQRAANQLQHELSVWGVTSIFVVCRESARYMGYPV